MPLVSIYFTGKCDCFYCHMKNVFTTQLRQNFQHYMIVYHFKFNVDSDSISPLKKKHNQIQNYSIVSMFLLKFIEKK